MEEKVKVSIIFPIFNNEEYIENGIRSVMNQTLKEIELILIDDGSTDGAPQICDRFALEDNRIKVVHKKNEGSAAGRNQGIDAASGKYVAFVESDDSVALDMYEKLYLRAEELALDVIKCGFYYCEGGTKTEAPFMYRVAPDGEVFNVKERPSILSYHASMWAGMYRREFLNENNLRCILTPSATYSDFSWTVMVMAYAKRISIYHEAFYFYNYENPNSSFRTVGEKCFYKPFHCKEANRILREAGVFEYVKEEIVYSQIRTCLGHARNIKTSLRSEYFNRLEGLFQDTAKEGLEFSRFKKYDKYKYILKVILSGNEEKFNQYVNFQISKMKLVENLKNNKITNPIISSFIRWYMIIFR